MSVSRKRKWEWISFGAILVFALFMIPSSVYMREVTAMVYGAAVETENPPAAEITPSPEPTPEPTPGVYYMLQKRDKGAKPEQVARLQDRLRELGYYVYASDGYFGDNTLKAVAMFQMNNGLEMDGIAGVDTQRVLFESADVKDVDGQVYIAPTKPAQVEAARAPEEIRAGAMSSAPLNMDDFSIGRALDPSAFTESGYEDDTIRVEVSREKIGNTVFNLAKVQIKHASQLRAALGGTIEQPASVKFTQLARRNNAVLAINGDYYNNRDNCYIVRQSNLIQSANGKNIDLMIVDYEGNFHLYTAGDKAEGVKELAGNIYQAFSFGPALVIDGVIQNIPADYLFNQSYKEPRTAIGQLGPLSYLVVVADGRTDYSTGVKGRALAEFMYERGCYQAYNLDGGSSASMYFNGLYNHMTDTGERNMFDILYFASASGAR